MSTLNEKPQRNYLSKLGTFEYEYPQVWHSALYITIMSEVSATDVRTV